MPLEMQTHFFVGSHLDGNRVYERMKYVALCKRELYAEHYLTTDKSKVTCKLCLRKLKVNASMQPMQPAAESKTKSKTHG